MGQPAPAKNEPPWQVIPDGIRKFRVKPLRDRPLGVKLLLLLVGLFALTLSASLIGAAQLTHNRMVADRVSKLQAVVEITATQARLLDAEVAAGRLTRTQAIARFRTLLYATRYNGDEYLFAYDYDGTVIGVGNNPDVQGDQRTGLRDVTGRWFIQDLIAAGRRGGDTVQYWYQRKPGGPPVLKLAYVKAFPSWNIVIGSGVYVGDIDDAFNAYLVNVGLVLLGALAAAGGLAFWIGRDVTASLSRRRAAEAKILHLAHHDTLTDLPNRAFLQDCLATSVRRASRDRSPGVALLLCDLDRFKEVNDTFGHPAGDELLRQAAQRMRATMRRDDILARLGGDEFAFVQMVTQYPREADSLAARVIEVLSRPFDVHGHTVSVGVSIGIATAPADATDAADLMKHADTALYVSKQRGRGQATMYRPEMSQGLRERHELAADLRRAFGRGEFVVLYQPIVDLPTRHVAGFEALVRWVHPTRGEVLPGAFIQIAEECGLLVQLGEWILRTACEDAASWDAEIRVAVNIALQQFETPGFFGLVRSALADAGLPADRLELEITERVMLNEGEHVRSVLQDLRAFGVHISLDDFGTGYSSLNHLQSFPIDKIKIDRSFIGSLGIAAEADAIVRAVVNLGATLGLRTLAEGIETQDQADRMLAARCHQGQGYLFGRPVPAGEVADAVARLGKGPTVPVVPTALPAAAATSASGTIAPA